MNYFSLTNSLTPVFGDGQAVELKGVTELNRGQVDWD